MLENFLRLAGQEQRPLLHDAQTIRHAGGVVHGVGDQNDGGTALAVQAADEFENFVVGARVQTGSRLIQNENLRLHREHAGDCDAALLSARQIER